jgi:hypothetical protein
MAINDNPTLVKLRIKLTIDVRHKLIAMLNVMLSTLAILLVATEYESLFERIFTDK